MMESSGGSSPSRDALKFLGDMVTLLGDKSALAKAIADLEKAMGENKAAAEAARAEQAKLADLRADVEAGVAELRTQAAQKIRDAEAALDRKSAEREVALTAREKRANDLLAKAEADSKKVAETRAAVERKIRAYDAA